MTGKVNQNLEASFAQYYDQYSDAIFRYCLYQTSNREKALDLTQDTFIKTWEYLSSGSKVENIKAFLYKVANNLIIDYRRKKKSESLDQMMEKGLDIGNGINDVEQAENIYEKNTILQAMNQLEEKYRNVLTLRFIENLSVKEIAKVLKKTENNISVRIHRGIQKLKEILEK